MRQVIEHAIRCVEHALSRTSHSAAQHSYCIGHVRSRLRGAVKQGSNEGLIGRLQFVVWRVSGFFGCDSFFNKFG
eukprot:4972866-Pleurochrysis_carterae.AAC.1